MTLPLEPSLRAPAFWCRWLAPAAAAVLLGSLAGCADVPPDYVAQNLIGCDLEDRLARHGYSTAFATSYETCIYNLSDTPAPWNLELINSALRFSVPNIDCALTPELIGVESDPLGQPQRLIFCPNGSCEILFRSAIDVALADDICNLPKDT